MGDFTPMDYFWSYATLPGVRTAVVAFVLLVWAVARTIRGRATVPFPRRGNGLGSPRVTVLRAAAACAALLWIGRDLLPLLGYLDERATGWLPLLPSLGQLIVALLPLASALLGLVLAQFVGNGAERTASGTRQLPTARRGWRSELSRGELVTSGALSLLLLLLAVWAGSGSKSGEDGWVTDQVISGSGFGSSSAQTFGWSFGIPTLLFLLLTGTAAVLLLGRTNRAPLPADPQDRSRETGRRRALSGTAARLVIGSALLTLWWALLLIAMAARTTLGIGTRVNGTWTEFRWESNIGGLADPLLAAAYLCGVCGAVLLLAVAFGWTPRVRFETERPSRRIVESDAFAEESR